MACYWPVQWLVGFVTPYMVDATAGDLGVKVAYIWLGMGVILIAWAYFYVPKLVRLSVTEVDTPFEEKVPARKSIVWKQRLSSIESMKVNTPSDKMTETRLRAVDKEKV
jgi:MFS transporter, SP family, sugar:H+ symporter